MIERSRSEIDENGDMDEGESSGVKNLVFTMDPGRGRCALLANKPRLAEPEKPSRFLKPAELDYGICSVIAKLNSVLLNR